MVDFLDVLLGDSVETRNAAIGRSVELEVVLLRAFHVHNVDPVVVRRNVFEIVVFCVRNFVQEVDDAAVNCLSTLFWSKPLGTSLFSCFSYFANTTS